MGQSLSGAVSVAQEKTTSVFCCCRSKGGSSGMGIASKYNRYGSLAGGKYDESDDEDARGILYNNNLLLDDDDEEEQIVIMTKEKTAKPEPPKNVGPVDHSVFKEG